jgi:trimethylamine-N-oxide reductase (cytochrome c)
MQAKTPAEATALAGISRRSFVSAALSSGAFGSSASSLLVNRAQAASLPEYEVLTGCHWGAFRAKVPGGRIVSVKPWEKDPRPSAQLPGVLDSVYSPTRIKYPMVRRAWLEHGPGTDPEGRGEGDFVRVSRSQALDLVAGELKRVRAAHGPTAIFAGSYGWKSPGKLHNCQSLLRRMLSQNGGFVNTSGDYSTGAAQVILPYMVGSIEVYEQPTAWPVVVENTDLMVFWGGDPINNNQIGYLIADHGAYPGLESLKKAGKQVICIDPVKTETCSYLDAEWLAPRPQTDVAMMLGIAHTLYVEKLHDEKFLARYTMGFDKFLPYLTGESDGVPKSAEWAPQICDISANKLKELARRFSKQRTMLACGYSLQRQHHGEQAHWMLITLASMLGQIGLPGGGYGLSYHYAGGGAPAATGPVLSGISDGGAATVGVDWLSKSGSSTIPVSRMVEMLRSPGKSFDFNGTKGVYPDVKLAYWVGGNPFAHQQDRNQMVEAWRKLETFIVHDFQWTATARRADIVLPAMTSYERNDIEQVGDYSLTHVLAMKKLVEPLFESRNDYDIFADISERLGTKAVFTQGRTEMDWIRAFYEAARVQARAKALEMPIFDAFWNSDDALAFPIEEAAKSYVRYADFLADPLLNALGTASGRIEIFSSNIEKMGYDDFPPHATWMEPAERLGGPTIRYPLHVDASHPKFRLHSQLCGTRLRGSYVIAGREPCLMNPADAARRSLKDGDIVRVFNDRGQILAGVWISVDIRPGVIRVNEGGWFDPVDPRKVGSLCRYGDVNNLTLGIGTSRLAQGNCGHTAVAEVEKYTGIPPKVEVFDAPANA